MVKKIKAVARPRKTIEGQDTSVTSIDNLNKIGDTSLKERRSARALRRRRESLDGANLKLFVPESSKEKGFHYSWARFDGSTSYQISQDWEFVNDPELAKVKNSSESPKVVVPDGSGGKLVLLRIVEEFYLDDIESEQQNIINAEEAIVNNDIGTNKADSIVTNTVKIE